MRITLPWPPTGLSPNARNHWAKTAKLKKQYREACYWKAIEQGARAIQADSLHLTITFYPPTRRGYDLDNALARIKAGLDGLVDVLKVDDKHWTISIKKGESVGGFVEVCFEIPQRAQEVHD